MPGRIEVSGSVSVVAVSGAGIAYPLGLVDNVRLEKTWVVEQVTEIGSFLIADTLIHGTQGRFSWGQAHTAGDDLVQKGLIPSDVTIPQFAPMFLRLISQVSQRLIALIHAGVADTYTIEINSRAKLVNSVSGICRSVLFESELN